MERTSKKIDLYKHVNDTIMELLDKGTVPWKQGWNVGGVAPTNLISKKAYRGINIMLLSCTPYASPYWLTFNQCKKIGGNVRKGEKSTLVVFWKFFRVDDNDSSVEGKQKTIPMLRHYRVFNIEQCDNIDAKKIPVVETHDHDPIDDCEAVVDGYEKSPDFDHHNKNAAAYSPILDTIRMPEMKFFENVDRYYSTRFHEMIHSTGHKSRLDRKLDNTFNSEKYGKEELIAEMGAAYLCGFCDIENSTIEDSVAYIKGWKKALSKKDAVRWLVCAAGAAQRATDHILGVKFDNTEEK